MRHHNSGDGKIDGIVHEGYAQKTKHFLENKAKSLVTNKEVCTGVESSKMHSLLRFPRSTLRVQVSGFRS